MRKNGGEKHPATLQASTVSAISQSGVRPYDGALRWASDAILGAFYTVHRELGSGFLEPAHEAQLLNYLRASELEVGLVLNFGERPSFKRLAYSNERKSRIVRADARDVDRPDRP